MALKVSTMPCLYDQLPVMKTCPACSKRIRQRPINLYTSPMLIHKIMKRLDTQVIKPTNQNSLKLPKIVKTTNKKKLLALV